MPRTHGSEDPEQLFLHNVIAGAGRIVSLIDLALTETDNPEVISGLLDVQKSAIMIQVRARDYEPRLNRLKLLAQSTGKDLRTSRKNRNNP